MNAETILHGVRNTLGIGLLITVCSCTLGQERTKEMTQKPQYIIDVRSPDEYARGHLQGAILIPHTEVERKIGSAVADPDSFIVLYCRSGRRADAAQKALEKSGYKHIVNLGGIEAAAKALKLPVVPYPGFVVGDCR